MNLSRKPKQQLGFGGSIVPSVNLVMCCCQCSCGILAMPVVLQRNGEGFCYLMSCDVVCLYQKTVTGRPFVFTWPQRMKSKSIKFSKPVLDVRCKHCCSSVTSSFKNKYLASVSMVKFSVCWGSFWFCLKGGWIYTLAWLGDFCVWCCLYFSLAGNPRLV